jgi:hypothetical protein
VESNALAVSGENCDLSSPTMELMRQRDFIEQSKSKPHQAFG